MQPTASITRKTIYKKRWDASVVNVLTIGYCDLRFIFNLVLGIWNFSSGKTLIM